MLPSKNFTNSWRIQMSPNTNSKKIKRKRIWVVQHETFEPVLFDNPTSALEYGREIIKRETNDYDGTRYISKESFLSILGYYVNEPNAKRSVLTVNLFNYDLIIKNNDEYERRENQEAEAAKIPP